VSAADRLTTPDHRFGLLRLKSTAAFSANRATWTFSDRLVTPSYEGHGALAAAYSPDRKKLAVVTNLRTPEFRVALVKPNEDKLDKPFKGLPLVGCDVAWRPDGAELAVVQAGASCADPSGSIVRASIADPRMLQTVVFGGRHPAWQPIDFNLGPERSLVPGKQR
jgi:hypothetical protein